MQYAAKSALPATINMDASSLQALGLDNISEQQAQLATAVVLSRPVCPCEAAHIMGGLPIIEHSEAVTYINSKPPPDRTVGVTSTRSGFMQVGTLVTPVTKYVNRPSECEDRTFPQYWSNYEVGFGPLGGVVAD